MHAIRHWIGIDAPPERVFEAVTTQEGLASWWTADVKATPEMGSLAEFGFNNHSIVARMRVDELKHPSRVRWVCLGGVEQWKDTRIEFRIDPGGESAEVSVVTFTHAGWRSTEGDFRRCNTDWGSLMYHLKAYAEGRSDQPMMADLDEPTKG